MQTSASIDGGISNSHVTWHKRVVKSKARLQVMIMKVYREEKSLNQYSVTRTHSTG